MNTVYDYYLEAAERHLETCKELKEGLKNHDDKKQKMILANIYYLSGYVIECAVNYGILKHIKFEKISEQYKITDVKDLRALHSKHKVSFSSDGNFSKYILWQKNHMLIGGVNKLEYFKNEVDKTGKIIGSIPWLGKPLGGPQRKLMDKWGANIRYEISEEILLLGNSEILNFQMNSEKIYNGIISLSKHL